MKKCPFVLFLICVLAYQSNALGQIAYDHDVDHGTLTLLSDDGFWRRYETEFPIIGGWMEMNTPTNAGNGPNGFIWVHQEADVWASQWGVSKKPISLEQYEDPSSIDTHWSWGMYYVYGENKILEYGALGDKFPPGTVSYTISYSAGVVPEPSTVSLFIWGIMGFLGVRAVRTRRISPRHGRIV